MSKLRWEPYVLLKGVESESFFKEHAIKENKKSLFILGKGFDVRMNIAIEKLISSNPSIDLDCILIEFDEGRGSSSHSYGQLVNRNMQELSKLLGGKNLLIKSIKLWKSEGRTKRRIGDRQAAAVINNYKEIETYTDIYVDISSLPRGIYFSLIGKILSLIDAYAPKKLIPNLFILTSENAKLDIKIREEEIDEDVDFLYGFSGEIGLTSDTPIIWFPILGEDKSHHLIKAHLHIKPDEICPILPFPSKDARRSDSLIIDYHTLLFDEFRVESQNIMYVPEQNPFEAYRLLHAAISNYDKSLDVLGGCKTVISTFSSKLLSIGTLLAAYELNQPRKRVGILNVDSQGYRIEDLNAFEKDKNDSELFVTWVTGEPYE